MGIETALLIGAIVGAAGTGVSAYQAKKSSDTQEAAQADAKATALKTEKTNDQNINRANQKQPDVSAILAAAQNASKAGIGSTMLTGPAGISPDKLMLGKTSLLGA